MVRGGCCTAAWLARAGLRPCLACAPVVHPTCPAHPALRPPSAPAPGLAAMAGLHSLVLEVLALVASRYPARYAPHRRWLITLAIAHLAATIHLLSEPQLQL